MTENELLNKLKEGDEVSFESIFRKHFTGLNLFAEHFLQDSTAAEEIVQEYFCDLWENCKSLNINTSLRGYLYKSIYHRCLKHIRNQKSEQKFVTRQYQFFDKEILESVSSDNPSVNLITKELENKITLIIDSLPKQCKKIFSMNRFENFTYEEISVELGISRNTVKTQMVRALKKLRLELKDYMPLVVSIFLSIK